MFAFLIQNPETGMASTQAYLLAGGVALAGGLVGLMHSLVFRRRRKLWPSGVYFLVGATLSGGLLAPRLGREAVDVLVWWSFFIGAFWSVGMTIVGDSMETIVRKKVQALIGSDLSQASARVNQESEDDDKNDKRRGKERAA